MLTDRKKKRVIFKVLILILITLNLLVPMLLIRFNSKVNSHYIYENHDILYPKTQAFSKGNYEPILNSEKQGLGNINITNIDYDEIGFNSSQTRLDLNEDLTSGALNMTYEGTKFIKTMKVAQVDNLNENITDYRKITILLNESIDVVYNASIEPLEGYLIYAPKLTPFLDAQLWVENDSLLFPLERVNEGNYSFEKIESINFLRFNYYDYFPERALNFTMHIIFEYNLTVDNWRLTQYVDDLLIEEEGQILNPKFRYEFRISGDKFINVNDTSPTPADNLYVNLTMNLPDKELLHNHKLSDNILDADKSVYTNFIPSNDTHILLDFNAHYILGFVEPLDETWSIDRLVEDRDIRERIYFPTIISGPSRIFIKHISILESTIAYDQVESKSSLFERPLSFSEINVSELKEEIENSLIFHENATLHEGIKITLPYIIRGEICPFSFKYEVDKDLRIIITDNIRMPLVGLEVIVYYYGEKYGTYISKEKNQPIGPTITDENGEILIENVPNGNFTVRIYDTDTGELIMKAEVSSFLDLNYVVTSIIHFPFWILIFGIPCAVIFSVGFIIYKKKETAK